MKSVAIICKFSWVGLSTSVINSVLFWESQGYEVDFYTEKPSCKNFHLLDTTGKNINIIISDINKRSILDDFYFRSHYFKKKKYAWVIAFDYTGLIRGGIAAFFSGNRLIYHSLEFFETSNSIRNKFFKFLELLFSYKAKYIFVQDSYRQSFLESDLHQNKRKFKFIYNSPNGDVITTKQFYFHNLFKIPKKKKIVLCTGSLIKEHCIPVLIDTVDTWHEDFVLVLHGWFPDPKVKTEVLEKKKKFPDKIFISEELFTAEEKHIPFSSCYIGFVGFSPVNNNLKYAAGSAGKIFDFMKSGIPVIGYDTPGMKAIIEDNNAGKVFSVFDDVNLCLEKINSNYDFYASHTYGTYKRYIFDTQYEKILKEINLNNN